MPTLTQRVVIGIDASLTNTGVVSLRLDGSLMSVTNIRPTMGGVDRLIHIQQEITNFVLNYVSYKEVTIEHICMEQYGFGAAQSQHSFIGEGGGAIKIALVHALGTAPVSYPTLVTPQQLKLFVLGRGSAKKSEMLLGVYKKYDVEFRDDNLADAYGLAAIALSLYSGTTKFEYEARVINSLQPHTEYDRWNQTTNPRPPKPVITSSSKTKTTRLKSSL